MHVSAITRTYVRLHARTRTHSITNSTRKRTQTIAAIDAWAISACKRDCVLRVGSKTFKMYYTYKQDNKTNLYDSFFIEKEMEKELLRWDSNEPMTYCLLGRCSTTKLPRELNGWVEPKLYVSTTYCLLGRCSTTKLPRELNGWVEPKLYVYMGNWYNLTNK